jgi:hypothetical protein
MRLWQLFCNPEPRSRCYVIDFKIDNQCSGLVKVSLGRQVNYITISVLLTGSKKRFNRRAPPSSCTTNCKCIAHDSFPHLRRLSFSREMSSTPEEVGTLIVVILKAASVIASPPRSFVSQTFHRKIFPIKDTLESKTHTVL